MARRRPIAMTRLLQPGDAGDRRSWGRKSSSMGTTPMGDLASTTTAYGTLAAATIDVDLVRRFADQQHRRRRQRHRLHVQQPGPGDSPGHLRHGSQRDRPRKPSPTTQPVSTGDDAGGGSGLLRPAAHHLRMARGQLLEQTDPSGARTFTTYTAAGFVQSQLTDGRGGVDQLRVQPERVSRSSRSPTPTEIARAEEPQLHRLRPGRAT